MYGCVYMYVWVYMYYLHTSKYVCVCMYTVQNCLVKQRC